VDGDFKQRREEDRVVFLHKYGEEYYYRNKTNTT